MILKSTENICDVDINSFKKIEATFLMNNFRIKSTCVESHDNLLLKFMKFLLLGELSLCRDDLINFLRGKNRELLERKKNI